MLYDLYFMSLILVLILGVLPSIVWLAYYLQSDAHPEPKSIILEVFILGMISGGAAAGFQLLLNYVTSVSEYLSAAITVFPAIMIAGWAFIEEYVKYLAAKIRILHDAAFDEPTDAMIYLIAAGLGFAAIENMLFVAPSLINGGIDQAIIDLFLRFITATQLHALASGIIGFFFALAIIYHSRLFLFLGFMLGGGLHTAYNYFIMLPDAWSENISNRYMFLIIAIILFIGFVFVRFAFYKLKSKRVNFS